MLPLPSSSTTVNSPRIERRDHGSRDLRSVTLNLEWLANFQPIRVFPCIIKYNCTTKVDRESFLVHPANTFPIHCGITTCDSIGRHYTRDLASGAVSSTLALAYPVPICTTIADYL